MKRREFVKAIPLTALLPAGLSARIENAQAAENAPAGTARAGQAAAQPPAGASGSGKPAPDWARRLRDSNMDGLGLQPEGPGGVLTVVAHIFSQVSLRVDRADSAGFSTMQTSSRRIAIIAPALLFGTIALLQPVPEAHADISEQDKEILSAVEKVAPTVEEIGQKLWDLSEFSWPFTRTLIALRAAGNCYRKSGKQLFCICTGFARLHCHRVNRA